MYIHWTHHYLPSVFEYLSFFFNPLFICLILTENKATIGNYRFLFLLFACFDMIYSVVEILVPCAIHGTGAAFVYFIADGPFFEHPYGELAIKVRSSFVALSYGILIVHFIYRYLILYKPHIVDTVLSPQGIVCVLGFFFSHAVVWFTICTLTLHGDMEIRDYIHDDFLKTYGVDSRKLAVLVAIYYDATPWLVRRSWTGIILLFCFSTYAVSTYCILGYKIMKRLKEVRNISANTARLHKILFKALVVQTVIPICISFAPCLCAWITPIIGVNLGMWNNYFGVVALSTFPTLDPLAIILLLPNYRNRLGRCIAFYCKKVNLIKPYTTTMLTTSMRTTVQ